MQKVVRFAVQNLKANHNKDYSVVKTFSADVLSLFLGHSFSFLVGLCRGRIGETKTPQGGAPEGFCGEDEILSPLRYESATR